VQSTIPRDVTKLCGSAPGCGGRLLDYDMLAMFQSKPHQRLMTVRSRNDQNNIHVRLHDVSRIRNQPQAGTARFKL
jgi:hypothetical protein